MNPLMLLLTVAGVYLLAKSLPGQGGGSGGSNANTADANTAAALIAAGQAQPGDRINTVTETTSQGQEITYNTVNYDIGDQTRGRVLISPDDVARIQGYYIPQLDASAMATLARANGMMDWKEWVKLLSYRADRTAGYDYNKGAPVLTLLPRDWEYFRLQANSGDARLPESVLGNTPISDDQYKDLLLANGAVLQGAEVHLLKSSGLGLVRNTWRT